MRRMAHPSSRRGRRPADHCDTERSIRLAALTRFADQGFHATGLRDITADAGVDVALISYKFWSKLGLWKSVFERVGVVKMDQLRAALTARPDREDRPLVGSRGPLVHIHLAQDTVP